MKFSNISKIVIIFNLFFIGFLFASEQLSETNKDYLPKTLLYPQYFKEHDKITWTNIKDCLNHRFNYIRRKQPVQSFIPCYKFQRRLTRAINRSVAMGTVTFNKIDNSLLFTEGSDINKVVSPQPILRDKKCNYHSLGDITKGCVMYCDYHGIDIESDFFKQHKNELTASKPTLISEDIAELIIYSPALILFAIIIFYAIPKKQDISVK